MPTDSEPADSSIIRTGSDGRLRYSPDQRQALLDAFDRSGMSAMSFTRQHGVHYQTSIAWIRKRRQNSSQSEIEGPGFAEVISRLGDDPRSGAVFVFINRSHNLLKLLHWDGTGLWVHANRHAPHCAYWFVFEDPLSIPSAFREGLRVLRLGWRQEGHGLRAACRPVDPGRARVDVRSGGLCGSESV